MQVEYGPMELDLALRVRVHCLMDALAQAKVGVTPSGMGHRVGPAPYGAGLARQAPCIAPAPDAHMP